VEAARGIEAITAEDFDTSLVTADGMEYRGPAGEGAVAFEEVVSERCFPSREWQWHLGGLDRPVRAVRLRGSSPPADAVQAAIWAGRDTASAPDRQHHGRDHGPTPRGVHTGDAAVLAWPRVSLRGAATAAERHREPTR
jgi:hypothetical protein